MKTLIVLAVLALAACGGSDAPADPAFPSARVQSQIAPNVVNCELSGSYKGCFVALSVAEPSPSGDFAIPDAAYVATVEVVQTDGSPALQSLSPITVAKFARGVSFGTDAPPGQGSKVIYRLTVSGLVNGGALVAK